MSRAAGPTRLPTRLPVTYPLTREDALRALALSSAARRADVKRAYRRLARQHHPDRGGDPDTFHEIVAAFERLIDDDTPPTTPTVRPGRPSRYASTEPPIPRVDTSSVNWTTTPPAVGTSLNRDRLAVALVDAPADGFAAVTATSRSPGSKLNGVARHLAQDSASVLTIGPATDDRRRPTIAVEVRAFGRRGRRALERAELLDRWTRTRGSSHTLLRSMVQRASDRRVSALLATDRAAELLDRLSWGLSAWTVTDGSESLG